MNHVASPFETDIGVWKNAVRCLSKKQAEESDLRQILLFKTIISYLLFSHFIFDFLWYAHSTSLENMATLLKLEESGAFIYCFLIFLL